MTDVFERHNLPLPQLLRSAVYAYQRQKVWNIGHASGEDSWAGNRLSYHKVDSGVYDLLEDEKKLYEGCQMIPRTDF
jgi:hypothetical protein